jgi:Flp pilus assembly pilin Flp
MTWFNAIADWCHRRLAPKLREDGGATTLEYVIIAAVVCVAAVIVAAVIVAAINNFASQIPSG